MSNVPVVVNAAGSSVAALASLTAVANLTWVVVPDDGSPIVNRLEYPVGAAVKALLDCLVVHAAINKFFVELQDVVNDGGSFTFVAAKDASGVPS